MKLKNNKLGIKAFPYSTIEDGFSRFNYKVFEDIYKKLISEIKLLKVPELEMLGKICIVDGSIFKLSIRADWAKYKSTKNGIKLHLCFDMNQVIIKDLEVRSAKESEIKVLKGLIEEGITYVCDRGYVSFDLFDYIVEKGSHFVIRLKKNADYEVLKEGEVEIEGFKSVKDRIVRFTNDKSGREYRVLSFKLEEIEYILLTDRLDLKAEEIILLYACRWQIELVFKFLKRTLNGIHLINEDLNGLYIQFYMLAIVELLLIMLKQECYMLTGKKLDSVKIKELLNNPVNSIGKRLRQFWKISKHWLEILRDNLQYVFSIRIARLLTL